VNAAILEFFYFFRIEHVIPAVDHGVRPENVAHRLDVVADARGAPHVIDGVLIAGIVDGKALGDLRPGMDQIGQSGFVELSIKAGCDLPRQKIRSRHDDVVAGLAGEQFCLERVVAVKGVVADGDAGFLGEGVEHRRRDIVGPVVKIDDALRGGCGQEAGDSSSSRRNDKGEKETARSHSVSVGSPAAFHAKIPPARCEP
jgi:hypothetical protein